MRHLKRLVYVAFVIDAYTRRIVGWRVSRSAVASFVLEPLVDARVEINGDGHEKWRDHLLSVVVSRAQGSWGCPGPKGALPV